MVLHEEGAKEGGGGSDDAENERIEEKRASEREREREKIEELLTTLKFGSWLSKERRGGGKSIDQRMACVISVVEKHSRCLGLLLGENPTSSIVLPQPGAKPAAASSSFR